MALIGALGFVAPASASRVGVNSTASTDGVTRMGSLAMATLCMSLTAAAAPPEAMADTDSISTLTCGQGVCCDTHTAALACGQHVARADVIQAV